MVHVVIIISCFLFAAVVDLIEKKSKIKRNEKKKRLEKGGRHARKSRI